MCLECFVGEGDSSVVLPATEEEIAAHKENKNDATFKIMECGSIDSELKRFDQIKKDVSDKVKQIYLGIVVVVRGCQLRPHFSVFLWNHSHYVQLIRQIQAGFSAVAQKATDTFTRRRRESGEDKYACAKVLHDGKAYRSCTPKLGTIR